MSYHFILVIILFSENFILSLVAIDLNVYLFNMKYIADLHIHFHFSRGTSKTLTPEHLDYHAGLKGIKVVGTGDFAHAGWLNELHEKNRT